MIKQNVCLQAYNTLALPAKAAFYAQINDSSQLQQALQFAKEKNLAVYVLGAGSNSVFVKDYQGLVLHMAMKGIALLEDNASDVLLRVAAGEVFDEFLQYCLSHSFYGLENLAIIPGTVGAAPIQNIGAYGVEVAQYIEAVEVWDREENKTCRLTQTQCHFAYRNSVFKQNPQRYIVQYVLFRLNKQFQAQLSYAALKQSVQAQPLHAETIREAVIALRTHRLPDVKLFPNAGSFFKNPLVSAEQFQHLQQKYAQIPHFTNAEEIKLPAAWLIEQVGWKGKRLGAVGMYAEHALVLVNYAAAKGADVLTLAQQIQLDVEKAFAIHLETEPVFVDNQE